MAPGSQRTHSPSSFTGPPLVRLLAQLARFDAPGSTPAASERLSQWLHWTDAIALSDALDGSPATGSPEATGADERDIERVRKTLAGTIAADTEAADPSDAFPAYRRRYLARQQAMAAIVEPLRSRLRTSLAGSSPAGARLAALDEAMERVLGGQERTLLAGVPALLEKHFNRLRAHHGGEPTAGWQTVFCQDLQRVMLAELDLRLQPAEGLLAALQRRPTSHHE